LFWSALCSRGAGCPRSNQNVNINNNNVQNNVNSNNVNINNNNVQNNNNGPAPPAPPVAAANLFISNKRVPNA